MTRILINAANTTAAGPRSLTLRLLPMLGVSAPGAHFTVVLPDIQQFRDLDLPGNMDRVFWRRARRLPAFSRLQQLYVGLPRLARATGAQTCLTVGDLGALGLPCPQVVLLHLALLVYHPRELAGLGSWSPVKRKYLEWHFGRAARAAHALIVQTPNMADRVVAKYDLARTKVRIIAQPPAIPRAASRSHAAIDAVNKPIKLLFLAAYYPHKNHGILPAVVRELRERQMAEDVQIFTTVSHRDLRSAMGSIGDYADVVTNLGELNADEAASALRSASALFLPTVVESYGLTYLESLAAGRPILTSDRDFARYMCGDLAIYFDPFDAGSIVDAITRLSATQTQPTPHAGEDFLRRAAERLAQFPESWRSVGDQVMDLLLESVETQVGVGSSYSRSSI